MPTLTIKKLPDDLYARLKARARARRRSLNAQVTRDLESIVGGAGPIDHAAKLDEVRRLRQKIRAGQLTDETLLDARQWGRH